MMEKGYEIIDNIIYTPSTPHQPDARGVGWVYYDSMVKNKDRMAQIDGLNGETETFDELLQKCVRSAIGLQTHGILYGDVVAVCTYNHLNSCVPHLSAMFIGAKIAAFDPSLTLHDAIHLFKIAMPKLIFVREESVSLIENVIREVGCETIIVVFGSTEHHLSFSEFAKPCPEELTFKPVTAKSMHDVVVILFSSGTTGLPKGICHTHFSILRLSTIATMTPGTQWVMFASDSPYWNVFLFYLHYSIQSGAARIIFPKFDTNNPWSIFNHRITSAFFNVIELVALCRTPKPDHIDTSALKLINTGGSPVSVAQIEETRRRFPNTLVRIMYGLSEVFDSAICFDIAKPEHIAMMAKKSNSCGLPRMGITYKIVDVETEETLGPNQKGELRLKTDMQLSGYYNMDSEGVWDQDGWLKTGDYGYYDEDCCFYMVDRIKEMFIFRNWHVLPVVLEGILVSHPAVFRAAVIGIRHEIDENHAMAVLQLHENANVSEGEIIKYVGDRVEDRLRLRAGVKFVRAIPLTPSGKINRWKVKQMVLQGQI